MATKIDSGGHLSDFELTQKNLSNLFGRYSYKPGFKIQNTSVFQKNDYRLEPFNRAGTAACGFDVFGEIVIATSAEVKEYKKHLEK